MPNRFKAFAFLDIDHPVVAWCVYRGVLVSAKAENHSPETAPVSMMFAGMLRYQDNVRLHNELLIEQVRARRFPESTSRLTGMYFFTEARCADAALSWGEHFAKDYLAELEVAPVRPVSVVDANWITHAPLDPDGRIAKNQVDWIERYWAGVPYNDNPVWESIVDGRAAVCGTELRERAYRLLRREFPNALDTLEISRLAAHLGSDLGQTGAWITQSSPGRFDLSYYMDFRDATSPQFLDRLRTYSGPRNLEDLAPGKDTFGMPDLRRFGCTFTSTISAEGHASSYRVHPASVQ